MDLNHCWTNYVIFCLWFQTTEKLPEAQQRQLLKTLIREIYKSLYTPNVYLEYLYLQDWILKPRINQTYTSIFICIQHQSNRILFFHYNDKRI